MQMVFFREIFYCPDFRHKLDIEKQINKKNLNQNKQKQLFFENGKFPRIVRKQ